MSKFNLPNPSDNERKIMDAINQIARFIDFGTGAPLHTPVGPAVFYYREDGAAGSAIYGWDGTSWTALV